METWKFVTHATYKLHGKLLVQPSQPRWEGNWGGQSEIYTSLQLATLLRFLFLSPTRGQRARNRKIHQAGRCNLLLVLNSTLIGAGSPSAVDVAHHPRWKPRPGWGLRLHCRILCPLACRRWVSAAQPKRTQAYSDKKLTARNTNSKDGSVNSE